MNELMNRLWGINEWLEVYSLQTFQADVESCGEFALLSLPKVNLQFDKGIGEIISTFFNQRKGSALYNLIS
jgi:hypothetical protein